MAIKTFIRLIIEDGDLRMKTRLINDINLLIVCAATGAAAGLVLWLFLRAVHLGTFLIWEYIPDITGNPSIYTVCACVLGGIVTGLFRKRFGDYPQSMKAVAGTVKKTGTYPYRKLAVILPAALLPLIFGSSVGPEAGMAGIIVALCMWVKENVSFAGENASAYSRIGTAVSLSVMFYSPLFGFFSAVENEDRAEEEMSKTSALMLYGISAVSAVGTVSALNSIFGKVSEGFPEFEASQPDVHDFMMAAVYLAAGILLGLFFEKSELFLEKVYAKFPPAAGEACAGLILGIVCTFVPAVQFSGEDQMAVLITEYSSYAPAAMIGLAFLKVILTNMCICFGLKGGHLFPLIFSAVALGYGISLMVFPGSSDHAVFAAAVVTASALSVSIHKPAAVTCLMFLCFPVRMGIWIFAASLIAGHMTGRKTGN